MNDIKVIIQEENFNAIIKEEKIVVKLNGNITSPVFSVNQKTGNVILKIIDLPDVDVSNVRFENGKYIFGSGDENTFSIKTAVEDLKIPLYQEMIVTSEFIVDAEVTLDGELTVLEL